MKLTLSVISFIRILFAINLFSIENFKSKQTKNVTFIWSISYRFFRKYSFKNIEIISLVLVLIMKYNFEQAFANKPKTCIENMHNICGHIVLNMYHIFFYFLHIYIWLTLKHYNLMQKLCTFSITCGLLGIVHSIPCSICCLHTHTHTQVKFRYLNVLVVVFQITIITMYIIQCGYIVQHSTIYMDCISFDMF